MLVDPRNVEQELRQLIDSGVSLGDALRKLHHARGLGLMFLWPAVMNVQQTTKKEAMRMVVHETASERR